MLRTHKILHIFSGIFLYMFNLYAPNIRIPITGINMANIIAIPNVIVINSFFRHLCAIYGIVTLSLCTIYCIKRKSVFPWLFESLKRPIYGHSRNPLLYYSLKILIWDELCHINTAVSESVSYLRLLY